MSGDRLATKAASGPRRSRRLAANRDRPLDEVGADRLLRRRRNADRVVRVPRVVDRGRGHVGDEHEGDADRQETQKDLREPKALHGADDERRRYSAALTAVYLGPDDWVALAGAADLPAR